MGGRTALVTGGSRGIGAAIAERLAAEGYRLTVAARRHDALRASVSALQTRYGVEAHAVTADMANAEEVRELARFHADTFGRLDVLVLSAGIAISERVADATDRAYQLVFDVNVRAPMHLVQATLPMLRASASESPERGAKIIALASILGVASDTGVAAYGASKAALISFCETVTLEESDSGVTATAISPGFVDTDMTAWKRDELGASAMLRTADIAELALSITRLSAGAVVPNIVVSRAGEQIWRA